ncbi:MAG: ABC transporter ATP-binding protein [Magnetospirillum sp. WYHS-4]
MAEVLLETVGLSRAFGGLHAVADLSLRVEAGRVHAVIGPNGAGKTTLVNLLSGHLAPTAGRVLLEGRDIAGLPPYRIARLGVGRIFQRTSLFAEATCLENCCLGAGGGRDAIGRARAALDLCDLGDLAEVRADRLSHGAARQLEIALMLSAGPRLLLLDEPLAGMGAEESVRTTALLKKLAGDRTLVLIEHDMDAVFALADTVTVMVDGRAIATGNPAAVRNDPAVQRAYLGHPA